MAWRLAVGSAAFAAVIAMSGCDHCALRIVSRIDSGGRTIGCCGAQVVEDITVPDERDVAIDLRDVAIDGRDGGHDLWLTRTDCDRLFEAPYPAPGTAARPTPRCEVLLGPVPPGRVSPRAELPPGPYRVFVQAYDSNPVSYQFRFNVSIWASTCGASPAAP